MSDLESKRAEVRRLQKVEQVKQLMANEAAPQGATEDDGDAFSGANSVMDDIGQGAQSALKWVGDTVDKYNPAGSALRAGIAAKQGGGDFLPAYVNQYGEENKGVPTGGEIAAKAGISTKQYDTPLIANPFTGRHVSVSPAGVIGGAAETALDPTTYIGGAEASALEGGAKLAEGVGARTGEAVGNYAAERAAKAATGEKVGALRKAAKVSPKGAGDYTQKIENLRGLGRTLLSEDDAGKPVIGWTSGINDIATNAARKRQFFGKQIGEVGPVVDKLAPNAIQPAALQADVMKYSGEIPNVGKARPVRARTAEEAKLLGNYGLSEEELDAGAKAKAIPFAEAQKIKGQYGWEPTANDALFSNQDAMNRIHGIVGGHMDQAVEEAKKGGQISDLLAHQLGEGVTGGEGARLMPSEEELSTLNKYQPAKQKYGQYKTAADAATNQALQTLARRQISPSSNLFGAVAAAKTGRIDRVLAAVGLNQLALNRGTAFTARAANAVSKKIIAAPQKFTKYLPLMQKAAKVGNPAVVALHHELMNNDPEYRKLIQTQDDSEEE